MIIDYSITNYRSIKEKQTLYLLAKSKKSDIQENKIFSFSKMKGFRSILSKGCVIYGHNASGKSNLLEAFKFFANFALDSQRYVKPSAKIPIVPFLLDEESKYRDSEFEVNFILEDVRYNYEIRLNSTRVTYESLKAYPNAIAQDRYTRVWNSEKGNYVWTSGDPEKYGFDEKIAQRTRENVTFLSFVNEEKNDIFRKVYDWFDAIVFLKGELDVFPETFTAAEIDEAKLDKESALNFIKCADIGIQTLNLNKREFDSSDIPQFLSQEVKDNIFSDFSGSFRLESTFGHRGFEEKIYPIEYAYESEGTQKLYKILGPIFQVLRKGGILFFDEIENSLHPLLLTEIVKLFFSDLHNPKGAQIIFTAHNTVLLEVELLNRDQIWFTEKSYFGETQVYPLLKYSPRIKESLVRGYLSGRYGAVKLFSGDCFKESLNNAKEETK